MEWTLVGVILVLKLKAWFPCRGQNCVDGNEAYETFKLELALEKGIVKCSK